MGKTQRLKQFLGRPFEQIQQRLNEMYKAIDEYRREQQGK